MRRPFLLATTLLTQTVLLPPVALAQPAATAATPAPGRAAAIPAAGRAAAPVRVRTGQHDDRGRVVLHFGTVPAYSLNKVEAGFELRLRGQYPLDLSTTYRLSELAGMEARQEGAETVLLLRGAEGELQAEAGAFSGMLYIDLRAPPPPAALEAAQRKLLDDAVRLGLMRPEQASAMLQAARPGTARPRRGGAPAPAPVVAAPATPPGQAVAAGPAAAPPAPPPAVNVPAARVPAAGAPAASPPVAAPPVAGLPPASPPAAHAARGNEDLNGLRDAVIAKLAVLNGLQAGAALPVLPPGAQAFSGPVASLLATPGAGAAAGPEPAPVAVAAPPALPSCPAAFSMQGWKGTEPFAERLPVLRAGLARSDQGAAEAAGLAEFYVGHDMAREALEVLNAPRTDAPLGALRERLERVRDVARLLLGQPLSPGSVLLAQGLDCLREDRPLWQALTAAASRDGATLARLAPQARAALRDVPQDLRMILAQRLADGVEADPTTLRTLLGAIRPATGLTVEQNLARNWQYARLARQEGNRADEMQYLEQATRAGGRSLPALFAGARMAALKLGRPGAEGVRAEARVNDILRTYRRDALGEEAAITYAERLLEQNELGRALAIADGASQASARPGTESRGARLAAVALRRLLADAAPEGQTLPEPGERLGLFWQYEGYATPGERGDDIRLAAMRLLLREGLADAARDLGQQITPGTARDPAATLLLARAEATAAQGDPRRALAMLGTLPPDDATRRASAEALARLGRLEEAAAQLEPLRGTADVAHRAELLFQAKSWRAAGTAYGDLLRDPGLSAPARLDATSRLASASALGRQRSAVPAELLTPEPDNDAMLSLAGTMPNGTAGVAGLRDAISRSRQIEALLPAVQRSN